MPQDETPTIDQLRELAEWGDIDAQYRLACCYAGGTGVPKDETQAKRWMQSAAEAGHADAQDHLGWGACYENAPPLNLNGLDMVERWIVSRSRRQFVTESGVLFFGMGIFSAVTGLISPLSWFYIGNFQSQETWKWFVALSFVLFSPIAGLIAGIVLYEIARFRVKDNDFNR